MSEENQKKEHPEEANAKLEAELAKGFEPPQSYDGWAVVYVICDGAVREGYLGIVEERVGNVVTFKRAIEFASVLRPSRDGGTVRTCHGTPLEFTACLKRVVCTAAVFVDLTFLTEKERMVYDQALREAFMAERSLTSRTGQNIVAPVQKQGLVDATGRPIGV